MGQIKELRKQARMTQNEVASLIGVTQAAFSCKELGHTHFFPEEMVIIIDVFGRKGVYARPEDFAYDFSSYKKK